MNKRHGKREEEGDMVVLQTHTATCVLTSEEPCTLTRLKKRYYLLVELVTAGSRTPVLIWVYDMVTREDLVPQHYVTVAEASHMWQTWYERLSR